MLLVDEIVKLLRDEPHEWTVDRYLLRHNRGDIEIWVANGRWFCDVHDSQYPSLPVWQRWRVWRAYKRWRDQKVGLRLQPVTAGRPYQNEQEKR